MDFNPQNVKHFGFAPHKMRKLYRQRIRHGFCDYDVCDMGYHLSCVLRNRFDGKYDDEPTPEQQQKEVDDAFAKLAHVFYDLWD